MSKLAEETHLALKRQNVNYTVISNGQRGHHGAEGIEAAIS